jgi:hypothetical protein
VVATSFSATDISQFRLSKCNDSIAAQLATRWAFFDTGERSETR